MTESKDSPRFSKDEAKHRFVINGYAKQAISMLEYLFNPTSITVIGASQNPNKLGSIVLKNIIKGGYKGHIYPIHPKAEKVMGLKAVPSIFDLDGVDLALIATPAKNVIETLASCVEARVKFALIFSSGFGELSEAGKKAEQELVSVARKGRLRFVGPNSVGVFSSYSNLHAMMPDIKILRGHTSLVSQSGNVGSQVLYRGSKLGIGFNMFVSSGNEADLHSEEYIRYFGQEPQTKVVLSYVEGFSDGKKFLEIAKEATMNTPIVTLKGGDTKAGADAVRSHTGALAGSIHVFNAALKQSGVIRAQTIEDLLDFALAFNSNLHPKTKKIAILTRGGGWGVIAADAIEKAGLELPELPPEVIADLDPILPSYWNKRNPIDTVMASGFTLMNRIIDILVRWEDVDGLLILGGFGGYFAKIWNEKEIEKVSRKMIELSATKAIFAVSFTQNEDSMPIQRLRENSIPVYHDASRAIDAYSKLLEYREYLSAARIRGRGLTDRF